MADRLVTIATFDVPEQAQMAKSALEAGGIPAAVSDEMTVSLFWHYSNALGGIKLQVREEDAERASAVLDEALGPPGERVIDPDRLATEAESTPPEPGEQPEPAATGPRSAAGEPPDEPPPDPYSREGYARRLFFAAWFGLVLPPIWFFALYLFLNAAFGEGELSPRGRYNLFVGGLLTALGLPLAFTFILLISPL
jgi:hypothetical protein